MFSLSACQNTSILTNSSLEKKSRTETLDPVFQYNPDYQYLIRKGDKISISIWSEEELSVGSIYGIYNSNEVYGKWLLVDANGFIEAPKIGSLQVLSKSIVDLKEELKAYYSDFLVNPIIDVKILNREVSIIGEVIESSTISLEKDDNTLVEVLTKSKGFDFYANLKNIQIIRQVGGVKHNAFINLRNSNDYMNKNIQIHAGDIIVVATKKHKNFDRRISIILPFTSAITTGAILYGTLKK